MSQNFKKEPFTAVYKYYTEFAFYDKTWSGILYNLLLFRIMLLKPPRQYKQNLGKMGMALILIFWGYCSRVVNVLELI